MGKGRDGGDELAHGQQSQSTHAPLDSGLRGKLFAGMTESFKGLLNGEGILHLCPGYAKVTVREFA